ncbi:MAG: glyoxalase, partial [Candidatus Methanomethylophilaceae archaeon]|nr:glyoxalase [Candidatus Methanomethylophilaceae archaeon]
AAVKRNSTIIIIKRSETVGIDTGIYLGVDNPYDLHRRLIDEGVIFIKDPERIPLGVRTSFLDDDGNVLNAIEMNAELRL